MFDSILEVNGLSVEILEQLSYPSSLGISLKKTLRHVDKEALLQEMETMADWLDEQTLLSEIALDYRIKSISSISQKYERYINSSRHLSQVFNDVLGFRAFCDSYEDVLAMQSDWFSVADLSNGKADDDGYRGVHLYFQKDNFHYPIEIQFNTLYDRQLNNWLHDYLYKKQQFSNTVGKEMRQRYENGLIRNEKQFQEVLNDVLSGR